MAIISKIGRKNLRVRVLIWSIYLTLSLGALSMIYPFLLMISGTTKSNVDTPEAALIPKFLTSDKALYAKDAEAFFNESLSAYTSSCYDIAPSFRDVSPPLNPNRKMVQIWYEFLKKNDFPFYYYNIAYITVRQSRGAIPLNLRRFKESMSRKFDGDITRLNLELSSDFSSWNSLTISPEVYFTRSIPFTNPPLPLNKALREFSASQPLTERYYLSLTGYYRAEFLQMIYTKDIRRYNKLHKTAYDSWQDVIFPARYPVNGTDLERRDWLDFVRIILNPIWIKADKSVEALFRNFLKNKWQDINLLNQVYQSHYNFFDEIPMPDRNSKSIAFADWISYLQGWGDPGDKKKYQLPEKYIYIDCIDFRFQNYLKKEFKDITVLNSACGTSFIKWEKIMPPQHDAYYLNLQKRKNQARWEFCIRNLISVSEYVIIHGKGLFNTAVYCLLAIIAALIINPMAAYALSRFKPPSTYKLLLFMMLTMAFPPMVTQIPVFLLLRNFNLLNTFYALILPGMANGYSIFLLKGFFDSLPQELYESAEIDGAGEFRIFWQITMSLSKPILAVIALNAFTLAYSNFMMALLICQDQNMWTIMPWLYQLQQYSTQGVIFASLVIAAVPTFIIFSLCQNIIMRGIVVPVEK
jgi:multiple sugar transport system permease protein